MIENNKFKISNAFCRLQSALNYLISENHTSQPSIVSILMHGTFRLVKMHRFFFFVLYRIPQNMEIFCWGIVGGGRVRNLEKISRFPIFSVNALVLFCRFLRMVLQTQYQFILIFVFRSQWFIVDFGTRTSTLPYPTTFTVRTTTIF